MELRFIAAICLIKKLCIIFICCLGLFYKEKLIELIKKLCLILHLSVYETLLVKRLVFLAPINVTKINLMLPSKPCQAAFLFLFTESRAFC